MDRINLKSIGRTGFRQQLAIIFIVGIVLASLISSIAITYLSGKTIRDRFIFEGYQTAETLASQSTLALLFGSPDNVQEYAEAVLNSPDIAAIAVYDTGHEPLLMIGDRNRLVKEIAVIPPRTIMTEDGDRLWRFIAPVTTTPSQAEDSPFTVHPPRPELLGYIQLVMGKETMYALTGDLLKTNILVSSVLAALLLTALLLLTSRVTRPINRLAGTMHRATTGETMIRANIEGPRDVTEMQIAFNRMMDVLETREQELRKARDSALESARIKGEFAATVSHELRTPLNGVIGMLELLQGMGLNSRQADYLEVARSSGESLLTLVNDILNFSRNDSGNIETISEDFTLVDLLDDIMGLIGTEANKKGLDIGFVIERDVPPVLIGDRSRLHQILVNLIGNAIKFTDSGEIAIHVELPEDSAPEHTELVFEIRDSGIGIPESAHKRIFEPFLQADGSTTRKYGGTGLGLAISKQIVEFMGGEIGVRSSTGAGSTFWFRLPFERAATRLNDRGQEAKLSGKSILIVDDSDIVRRQARRFCEDLSMRPMTAESLKEMTAIIDSRRDRHPAFDYLLIDANLKGDFGQSVMDFMDSGFMTDIDHVVLIVNGENDADASISQTGEWSIRKPLRKSAITSILLDALAQPTTGPGHSQDQDLSPDAVHAGSGPFSARVLVVEDNRSNQLVVSGMLNRLGIRSLLAANGHEALEAIRREPFDLVLMDCNMPDMDGYETTRRLRTIEGSDSHVPVVAMTANDQEGDIRKCLDAGMDDYLSKPLKLELLQHKIDQWISKQTGNGGNKPVVTNPDSGSQPESGHTLDLDFFYDLKDTLGPAFPSMLKVFIEDLPGYLANLEFSIRNGATENIPNIAHAIKGSAANIGASRLAEISRHIETAGRAMDTEAVRMLYNTAMSEAQALSALLRLELEGKTIENSGADAPHVGRILVVDDDRSTRFGLRNVLEEEGYIVLEAGNGVLAIEMCNSHMPDLILMDGKMPVKDGFSACQHLKQQADTAHIPILIITGLEDDDSIEKAFSVGATDYISKPVNFSVLRRRISHLMHASRTERHMHRLAYSDSLTGLPNRTRFTGHLANLLDSNRDLGRPLAVMFIDVDRFKLINDTLGHDAGDMLLKIVAERLHHCVRDGDMVARLGGDEFTIVLDNIGSREVLSSIASKICTSFSRPVSFLDQEIFITLSIGISMFPSDASDMATLMKHADTAMFNAKRYRNDFRFFEYGMEADVAKRLKLESDLRRAVERDELLIHYQPQIETRTGVVTGAEALVRWRHPERGIIAPADFIPLAEDTGLISQIGEQVFYKACRQLMDWLNKGYPPLRMAINLSVRQIEKCEIINTVTKVLEETGIPPDCLELEITESVLMAHAEEMISIFRNFKEMKLHLAIDDFGTGYSSLAYLKRFPIDILKIDRSFVQDIPANRQDIAIITGVIAMARGLGLEVTAEGVENSEQAQILREAGCDYMQGYYFSEPLSPDEFERRFLSGRQQNRISNGDNVTVFVPK
jgi:diguanylate cyclase (GGDEF)-like protein